MDMGKFISGTKKQRLKKGSKKQVTGSKQLIEMSLNTLKLAPFLILDLPFEEDW